MSDTVPESLQRFFKTHGRVAIAFSGGVDSSYLLHAAHACGCDLRAYSVESQFRSPVERDNASRIAESLGIKVTIIPADPLSDENIVANRADRCYLCKKVVFSKILSHSAEDECDCICDASNASDDPAERPGMKAIEEMGVLSPLREAGLTKAEVRELSHKAGLPNWNTPSDSCLATRIATNTPITEELLRKTADCESSLRSMGFEGIRVRTLPDYTASLELPDSQRTTFEHNKEAVDHLLDGAYQSYIVRARRSM